MINAKPQLMRSAENIKRIEKWEEIANAVLVFFNTYIFNQNNFPSTGNDEQF